MINSSTTSPIITTIIIIIIIIITITITMITIITHGYFMHIFL